MAKRGRIHYRYPRRHFRRRRSGGMTVPIAPIAGLLAGLAEPIQAAIRGDFPWALNLVTYHYTGITGDGTWSVEGLKKGVLPLVVGLLIHKFVGGRPLNANAALARAKVPLIRI